MLEHRDFQVYGGNHLIFVYLAKAEPTIGNTLLNTGNDPELEHNIKAAIGWYLAKVMNPCQQFSKLKLDPASSGSKGDEQALDKEIFAEVLDGLDKQLVSSKCIAGKDITIADLLIYNDVSQFLMMAGLDLTSPRIINKANLKKWLTMMSGLGAVS